MSRLWPVMLLSIIATGAFADLNIGVTLSASGPAASLGMPEKNTIELLPKAIAGQKVNYIVLDDASDSLTAVKNAKTLIGEHKVDLIIGSTTTPNSLAMIDVVAASETPMIALAASSLIVEPMDYKRMWVFKTPQNDAQMSTAIVEHMTNNGVKTAAYIGFADNYGEDWWKGFSKLAEVRKIKLVGNERFRRTDAMVGEQVRKVMAAKPDAVLIGAAGMPAMAPLKLLREKGYLGLIYQTHAVANRDWLHLCARDCEGVVLPVSPLLVAAQLPVENQAKKPALEYIAKYEARYGKGSVGTFGAYAWDAGLLLANAAPIALKKAQPGSREFRVALRDALEESKNIAATHGVFNMSAADHQGFDQRARVMVRIENNNWKLVR